MGWYTDLKKKTRPAANYLKRQSGKIARESLNAAAAVTAGTACAVPPLTPLAPACAAGAALAMDAAVGDRVERVTKRAIDQTGSGVERYVKYLRGEGKKTPRPPGMATKVTGHAAQTTLRGDATEEEDRSPFVVAAGIGSLAILVTVVAVLKRTGRL